MRKLLAHLSLFVPQSLLSTKYLLERLDYLLDDPSTCDHDWDVVAGITSTVELQVQCRKCATYSEVPDPSKEEWTEAAHAMVSPYPWHDKSRVRYHLED